MTDTPLSRKIKAEIAADGPIPVADYMARCLLDPEHGYYATRDPLGAAGDFVTAPEISQMFGEMIGAWLVHVWREIGRPGPVNLVELGPGRGTLMADILRVTAHDRAFVAAAGVHLVEASPVLRERQAKTLRAAAVPVEWHGGLHSLPAGPVLVVANEFLDALPVTQYVRAGGQWRERAVGLDEAGNFALAAGPGTLPASVPGFDDAPQGAILELRPAADAVIALVAERIVSGGGAALVIDYGHAESALGDTLQAVRDHGFADPLTAPGLADLTAHVDFAALKRAAAGAACHGPIDQGAFLTALGIRDRAAALEKGKPPAVRRALFDAVERLTGQSQMGSLFKVMAITRPNLVPPPFRAGGPSGV